MQKVTSLFVALALGLALFVAPPSSSPVEPAVVNLADADLVHHAPAPSDALWHLHSHSLRIVGGSTGPRVAFMQAVLNRWGWHTRSAPHCSRLFQNRVTGTWNTCDADAFYAMTQLHTRQSDWSTIVNKDIHWNILQFGAMRSSPVNSQANATCRGYDTYPPRTTVYCTFVPNPNSPRTNEFPMYYHQGQNRWFWQHPSNGNWHAA